MDVGHGAAVAPARRAGVDADAEIAGAAPRAREAVAAAAADARPEVVLVGVVDAELLRVAHVGDQLGSRGIAVLEAGLQREADEAREAAEALGAVEVAGGRVGRQHQGARGLQGVAERFPGPPAAQGLRVGGIVHRPLLSKRRRLPREAPRRHAAPAVRGGALPRGVSLRYSEPVARASSPATVSSWSAIRSLFAPS